MESQTPEGLVGINWPSVEKYQGSKFQYEESTKKEIEGILARSRFTRNLPDVQKGIGRDLLLDFMWGVKMVADLSGYKEEIPKPTIFFDETPGLFSSSLSFWKKPFLITQSRQFIRLLQLLGEGKKPKLGIKPYIKGILPAEAVEISGVEEMAHILFMKKKGVPGRYSSPLGKPSSERLVDYFSQDVEERALFWKVAYTKHYFPHLYPQYEKLLNAVQIFRTNKNG